MRRTLILFIALAMIPLFVGIICPCAMAAPSNDVVFQKAACQGCCPEMAASPECGSGVEAQTFSLFTEFFKVPNVLKALNLDESLDIAINRRALVPAGDEPSPGFSNPLYLSLQVLRI